VTNDKSLTTNPSMKVQTYGSTYEMCESRILYGVEVWGLKETWGSIVDLHDRFCKKLLGLSRCSANGVAEMRLVKNRRRRKFMWLTVQVLAAFLRMDFEDPVRQNFDWQKGNSSVRFGSGEKQMIEHVVCVGLTKSMWGWVSGEAKPKNY
jgi:hypothetical protein